MQVIFLGLLVTKWSPHGKDLPVTFFVALCNWLLILSGHNEFMWQNELTIQPFQKTDRYLRIIFWCRIYLAVSFVEKSTYNSDMCSWGSP